MKLGAFLMPSHPPERSIRDGQRWDLSDLEQLDALGFEEAWIGEHFTPHGRASKSLIRARQRSIQMPFAVFEVKATDLAVTALDAPWLPLAEAPVPVDQ
jgi:hypothetical protein